MNEAELPVWVNVLGNFGFPILITLYLLMRFEKKIDNLEVTITKLIDVIRETRGK